LGHISIFRQLVARWWKTIALPCCMSWFFRSLIPENEIAIFRQKREPRAPSFFDATSSTRHGASRAGSALVPFPQRLQATHHSVILLKIFGGSLVTRHFL
jgi:hypothetical protein